MMNGSVTHLFFFFICASLYCCFAFDVLDLIIGETQNHHMYSIWVYDLMNKRKQTTIYPSLLPTNVVDIIFDIAGLYKTRAWRRRLFFLLASLVVFFSSLACVSAAVLGYLRKACAAHGLLAAVHEKNTAAAACVRGFVWVSKFCACRRGTGLVYPYGIQHAGLGLKRYAEFVTILLSPLSLIRTQSLIRPIIISASARGN
jgi:hypothetical protein